MLCANAIVCKQLRQSWRQSGITQEMKAALQTTVPFPIAKIGGWTQQKAVGVKRYVTAPHLLLQPSRGKSNTWWSKHMNTLVTVEGPWHQHTLKLLHDCHYLVCVQCIMIQFSFTLVVLEHVTWHVSMCMHVTGQILAGPAFLCSQHLCISCASVNILVEWLSMGSRHDHCSGHVTFLLNCSVILSVTFLTLMLWNFLLWFLALTNVLERPCGFWDNSPPHCHIQQLAVEFKGTQLTQTVHGMSQNDLSNKAVSNNVHVLFLTPLVLFSTHLDLYVCWCQSDNMQRNATQYSCACSYCRSIKLCKLLYPWESVSESLRLRSNQSRNDCRSEACRSVVQTAAESAPRLSCKSSACCLHPLNVRNESILTI